MFVVLTARSKSKQSMGTHVHQTRLAEKYDSQVLKSKLREAKTDADFFCVKHVVLTHKDPLSKTSVVCVFFC